MAKTIQIRNVPEDLYGELKARAVSAGVTLSDYLLDQFRQAAARPTLDELVERLRDRTPIRTSESSAETIRRHRDAASTPSSGLREGRALRALKAKQREHEGR
jgi:hypothetical protein